MRCSMCLRDGATQEQLVALLDGHKDGKFNHLVDGNAITVSFVIRPEERHEKGYFVC